MKYRSLAFDNPMSLKGLSCFSRALLAALAILLAGLLESSTTPAFAQENAPKVEQAPERSSASSEGRGTTEDDTELETLLSRSADLLRVQQIEEAHRLLNRAWSLSNISNDGSARARVRLAQADLLAVQRALDESQRHRTPAAKASEVASDLGLQKRSADTRAGAAAPTPSSDPRPDSSLERFGQERATPGQGNALDESAAADLAVDPTLGSAANDPSLGTEEAYYREAIELADQDPTTRSIAVNNLAVLWIDQQQWRPAIELLEQHLPGVPEETRPLFTYNYGLALEGAGRLTQSFAAYVSAAINELSLEQTELSNAYQGVLRSTGRWLLPTSAVLAVDLVRAARQAGRFEQAQTLLEAFLPLSQWFELDAYEHGLLAELLALLSSERDPERAQNTDWPEVLEQLEERLPQRSAAKVAAISHALRPIRSAGADDPWAAWRWPPADRKHFSAFLKHRGDSALRQERWADAMTLYADAWDVDPANLDAAAYLLNVLAVGPARLDPEGSMASAALLGLQLPEFSAQASELAGTLQLAGEALQRRDRLDEAVSAWQLAQDISDPADPMYEQLTRRIAAAENAIQQSTDEEAPGHEYRERQPDPRTLQLGPKKRVAVAAFENRAGSAGEPIAPKLATTLLDDLSASGRLVATGSDMGSDLLIEQNLANADPVRRTAAIQRMTRADVLVQGTVLSAEERDREDAGLAIRDLRIGGKAKAKVTINLRLYEVTTGRVLSSWNVEGEARRAGIQFRKRGSEHGDDTASQASRDSLNNAAEAAVAEALPRLLEVIDAVQWERRVVRTVGDKIYINAGHVDGITEGLELEIVEPGETLRDPETNEFLGRLENEIATVRIERVEGRFAIGNVVSGEADRVQQGNLVRLPSDD